VKPFFFFFFFFVVYIKYGQVKKGAKRTQHIARERERKMAEERERGGGTITDYNKMAPSHAFYPLEKKRGREKRKKKEEKLLAYRPGGVVGAAGSRNPSQQCARLLLLVPRPRIRNTVTAVCLFFFSFLFSFNEKSLT